MNEESAIATIEAAPEVAVEDVFVFARNQGEMQVAQQKLVLWARGRVAKARVEMSEAKANLTIATDSKWRTGPFTHIARKAEKAVHFYEKLALAFEAGYCIVPDMDVDIFAVRTTRKNVKRNERRGWNPPNQESNAPAAGEGRYVAPDAIQDSESREERDNEGKLVKRDYFWADEFKDADFPFKLAKPAILGATAEAMALRVFDEIGVLPRQKRPDPMVVGRVKRPSGGHVSFIIAWFVDTSEF